MAYQSRLNSHVASHYGCFSIDAIKVNPVSSAPILLLCTFPLCNMRNLWLVTSVLSVASCLHLHVAAMCPFLWREQQLESLKEQLYRERLSIHQQHRLLPFAVSQCCAYFLSWLKAAVTFVAGNRHTPLVFLAAISRESKSKSNVRLFNGSDWNISNITHKSLKPFQNSSALIGFSLWQDNRFLFSSISIWMCWIYNTTLFQMAVTCITSKLSLEMRYHWLSAELRTWRVRGVGQS